MTCVTSPLAGRATGPVIGLRQDGGAEAAKPLELAVPPTCRSRTASWPSEFDAVGGEPTGNTAALAHPRTLFR
jgi:hypothetical protein